jgi:Flp pilus assembly pilin Flp
MRQGEEFHMQDVLSAVAVRLQNAWFQVREGERGQGLVEYALIIAIVSLGAIAALTFLKGSITGLFSKAGSSINNTPAG